MTKRVRDEDESERDPFKVHHLSCLTWLWVRKVDPLIRKCVNKDIAKKIVGYLKVDLRDGIGQLKLYNSIGTQNIWYWMHKKQYRMKEPRREPSGFRPCVGCLRPILQHLIDSMYVLSCSKCTNQDHLHRACCRPWTYSIDSKCFEPFRSIYDLP